MRPFPGFPGFVEALGTSEGTPRLRLFVFLRFSPRPAPPASVLVGAGPAARRSGLRRGAGRVRRGGTDTHARRGPPAPRVGCRVDTARTAVNSEVHPDPAPQPGPGAAAPRPSDRRGRGYAARLRPSEAFRRIRSPPDAPLSDRGVFVFSN